MRRILLIIVILLVALTFVSLFLTQNSGNKNEDIQVTEGAEKESGAVLIGGDFSLVNQDGVRVTNKDFAGRVMVVFFGFTRCPDECPVTTATLARSLLLLGDKASQVAPIFITVDPEHDTPEVLKAYLGNIDSRITGLTGTHAQIEQVAAAYKTYFSASGGEKDATHEEHDTDDHHEEREGVDHSAFVYIMGKDGVYVRHFNYNVSAEELVSALASLIN